MPGLYFGGHRPQHPTKDYEGRMAVKQLKHIVDMAEDLMGMIEDHDNLHEWVQYKLATVKDRLSSIHSFMSYECGTPKYASVNYRGQTFPGYNIPVANRGNSQHKKMVLAKKGDKVKLIRFGHKGYKHNYNKKAKSNYLTRSAGIRNKSGQLTKNDKFSANYWSRRVLWPRGQKADGSSKKMKKKASLEQFYLVKEAEKGTAVKRDPAKWARAKAQAKARMGGKHSARAMQLAVQIYKKSGGTYAGKKPSASNNKMRKWTKQKWRTRPGTSSIAKKSDGSTSRYLPEKKWKGMSKKEQLKTDLKKRRGAGQYVDNTKRAKVKSKYKYY